MGTMTKHFWLFVQLRTGTRVTGIMKKHGPIHGPAHLSCLYHLFYLHKRGKKHTTKEPLVQNLGKEML